MVVNTVVKKISFDILAGDKSLKLLHQHNPTDITLLNFKSFSYTDGVKSFDFHKLDFS